MLWFFLTLPVLLQCWCLTCQCIRTLTPRGNRKRPESGIYFKIFEKTQYLMNNLYCTPYLKKISITTATQTFHLPFFSDFGNFASFFAAMHYFFSPIKTATRCQYADLYTYFVLPQTGAYILASQKNSPPPSKFFPVFVYFFPVI